MGPQRYFNIDNSLNANRANKILLSITICSTKTAINSDESYTVNNMTGMKNK